MPAATAVWDGDTVVMENAQVRAVINAQGEVVSYRDKTSRREYAGAPMNRLCLFKDVPRLFDAWDIDTNYVLQPVDIDTAADVEIVEHGGLRAVVRVRRQVSNSAWQQDIVLTAAGRRIDFETTVDWNELHRLLKVSFPMAVCATEAINEIQFGYITRPTHQSRQYDDDRFEVCNQRYTALCDATPWRGRTERLQVRRQPKRQRRAPYAAARGGKPANAGRSRPAYLHLCVLRLGRRLCRMHPWCGKPMRSTYRCGWCGAAAKRRRAFTLDSQNVFIDTVKPAEDGSGDLVLRLYEAMRGDVQTALQINLPVQAAYACDMLENKLAELPLAAGSIPLHFHTFEVKTLRLKL